jgi:hypothetical protein
MNEGRIGDEYLILFAESEVARMSEFYRFPKFLGGFQVLSLCGWDSFIVREENIAWISPEEHAQLVRWWNDRYRSLENKGQTTPRRLTSD